MNMFQSKPPAYNLSDIRVHMQIYFSSDDLVTGPKVTKQILKIFKPDDYHIIKNKLLSHQDTLWAWDGRCYIYDDLIDSFDRLELQRAGFTPHNIPDEMRRLSDNKKRRIEYRLKNVPRFIDSLQFQRTCPNKKN